MNLNKYIYNLNKHFLKLAPHTLKTLTTTVLFSFDLIYKIPIFVCHLIIVLHVYEKELLFDCHTFSSCISFL